MNSAFVSSMMRGYAGERQAARAGIEGAGWRAVMADHATASPDSAKAALLHLVARSDAVILLLGGQYGVPGETGFSPTEDEFVTPLSSANRSSPSSKTR